jgi:hypothetical protein
VTRAVRLVLVAAGSAILTLLIIEGTLSFTGARTLAERLAPPLERAPALRVAGGAAGPGLEVGDYDLHVDPAVGRVLVPQRTHELHGARVTTDAAGLRVRAAPPLGGDPLRVVVLGDSVAFGWGLADDETLAHQLEALLERHRPPGGRPVEARTVAVPGWNADTACAYLFDHLAELDPDAVVFVPVINDLSDNIAEYRTLQGDIPVPDLNSEDPWFHVGYSADFLGDLYARIQRGEVKARLADAGVVAVDTGLGRLSRERYARMGATLAGAAARLAERGARLYVAPPDDGAFTALLAEALLDAGSQAGWLPLFTRLESEEMQAVDPHPSALAVGHMAGWIAQRLQADELLPWESVAPLTGPSPDVQARRAAPRDPAAIRARAEDVRAASLARLLPRVDTESGKGCLQVYGGLHERGEVGARVQIVVRREADELLVRCEPLAARPDLLPLRVAVLADGAPAGGFEMSAGQGEGPREFRVPLAPRPHGVALDVKLVPDRHAVVPAASGGVRLGSFRLLAVECVGR